MVASENVYIIVCIFKMKGLNLMFKNWLERAKDLQLCQKIVTKIVGQKNSETRIGILFTFQTLIKHSLDYLKNYQNNFKNNLVAK